MKKKRQLLQKVQKKKLRQVLNENRKKYITSGVVIAVLIVTAILLISFNSSKAMDTTTLLSDQVVEDLKFTNTTLDNNKLTVAVYNTLEDRYSLKTIDVTFQDENYEEITTVRGYIGSSLEKQDTKQLVVSTDVDLTNAKHIKYTINK